MNFAIVRFPTLSLRIVTFFLVAFFDLLVFCPSRQIGVLRAPCDHRVEALYPLFSFKTSLFSFSCILDSHIGSSLAVAIRLPAGKSPGDHTGL